MGTQYIFADNEEKKSSTDIFPICNISEDIAFALVQTKRGLFCRHGYSPLPNQQQRHQIVQFGACPPLHRHRSSHPTRPWTLVKIQQPKTVCLLAPPRTTAVHDIHGFHDFRSARGVRVRDAGCVRVNGPRLTQCVSSTQTHLYIYIKVCAGVIYA